MTRLREHYKEVVRDALLEQFSYGNSMEIPRLEKIVINMGVGDATQDRKKLDGAVADLAAITGQKPIFTVAKKSVAAFKLREGMNIGCKVTLRRDRMFEFLDRLVTIALPRVRDLKEQFVFPEVEYDKVDSVRGMDIIICTTAKSDDEALALLKGFDLPFGN